MVTDRLVFIGGFVFMIIGFEIFIVVCLVKFIVRNKYEICFLFKNFLSSKILEL